MVVVTVVAVLVVVVILVCGRVVTLVKRGA